MEPITQEQADDFVRTAFTSEDGSIDWRAIRLAHFKDATEIGQLRIQRRNHRRALRELQAAYNRVNQSKASNRDAIVFAAGVLLATVVFAWFAVAAGLVYGVLS